ncbi:FAD-dependent oxidoreductase [Lacibacter sp.]|uniref:FAD-dependent oxidoreductase n=1 Tax=Lacibacter sp. TaxID=1915409 RepID=UPI002B4B4C70|nr:FAD-dependent oxidoreductase [Lacibacter sp.]HLP38196.1 FAD-dependent oxidoreductase [Lacibacter sp.]
MYKIFRFKILAVLFFSHVISVVNGQKFAREKSANDQAVDICVYGATSAGVMAAYAAVMQGKTVALIQPDSHLGGLSSGGLGYTDIGNKYVITGLARDFYRRLGLHYGKLEQWIFEPHVAKNIFQNYLDNAGITVQYNRRVVSVQKSGTTIVSITTESSDNPGKNSHQKIRAKVYIDCSYEGDLMAKSGVKYYIGREPNSLYKETYNGVQLEEHHQFPDGIDPYIIPGKKESGLIWGISKNKLAPRGSGDRKVQAYNFRICLTDSPQNRLLITRPEGYDSTNYELLVRVFQKQGNLPLNYNFLKFDLLPNRKTDINNWGGMSTDMIGMNHLYPEADYETRKKIIKAHELYNKGLLYFLANDKRVPEHIRSFISKWGYPKDEYTENEYWSPQLYVREARRMIGEYVMTQANCEGKEQVKDGIGMAAYTMDSHNCQRIVLEKDGMMMVKNEGDVQVGGFPPYDISYRSLLPKSDQCTNLIVPVCLSASHIAFGSIRMEPVFMVLAQSAAYAAALSIDQKKSVQEIDVLELQTLLRNDPLANGSRADILLDNDITPDNVIKNGNWHMQTGGIAQLGGSYAKSFLIADENEAAASVKFLFPVNTKGKYKLYIYNSGNPESKASVYQMSIQMGTAEVKLDVSTTDKHFDWTPVGQFEFGGKEMSYVEIKRKGSTGKLVADAVLLIPVKE